MASTEIAKFVGFDNAQLRAVESIEAAIALFDGLAPVESVADYGDGFTLIDGKDKKKLVGVPLMFIQWTFNESASIKDADGKGNIFVSVYAITRDGLKIIFNDGSTGICKQLQSVTAARVLAKHSAPNAGLMVPQGLDASTYEVIDAKGVTSEATTYYISGM